MRSALPICLILLLAVPVLASAEKKKSNQYLFQGEWTIIKLEQEGNDAAAFIKNSEPVTVYKGDKYTFKGKDLTDEVGEFKLDPKAKTPTIDYIIKEGTHKGKRQLGIYKLDGDSLTICLGKEGDDVRPTAFKTRAEAPEYVMFTMTRKK